MTTPPDPTTFRRGDKLWIEAEYRQSLTFNSPSGSAEQRLSVNVSQGHTVVNILVRPSDVVKHIPRAIEVGDTVNVPWGTDAKILCVNEGTAFYRYPSGQYGYASLSYLIRVEPTDD